MLLPQHHLEQLTGELMGVLAEELRVLLWFEPAERSREPLVVLWLLLEMKELVSAGVPFLTVVVDFFFICFSL